MSNHAFAVRVPVVFLMSNIPNTNLFLIGISTPISTVFQIIICLAVYKYLTEKTIRSLDANEIQ